MKQQDKIDDYILSRLNAEEMEVFRRRLKEEPDLAKAVKRRQSIALGFEGLGHEKKRERIQAVRRNMLNESNRATTKSITTNKLRLWIAAASVLILAFLAWQIFADKSPDYQQLFAENYEIYDASFGTRKLNGEANLLLAEEQYHAQNYAAAIPLLKQVLNDHPTDGELVLTLGNAYLGSQQIDFAITSFTSIIQRNDPLYIDHARWYLALCYLKKQQLANCKMVLEQLTANTKNDFYKEANALLNNL